MDQGPRFGRTYRHEDAPRIEIKVVMQAGQPARITATTTVDNESVMESLARFIHIAQEVGELREGL